MFWPILLKFPSAAKKSCGSHLFGVGPEEAGRDRLCAGINKSRNFFVLGPILVKFHIRTRLIKSFPTMYGCWRCAQEKLHFTPFHTSMMPIEVWRKADSTTLEGRRVSSEVRLDDCTQVLGLAKFGQHVTHSWGKIGLHTCSDLSKSLRTCPNLSTLQWPCTLVAQSFFAFLNALILQSDVLSWWNCIF